MRGLPQIDATNIPGLSYYYYHVFVYRSRGCEADRQDEAGREDAAHAHEGDRHHGQTRTPLSHQVRNMKNRPRERNLSLAMNEVDSLLRDFMLLLKQHPALKTPQNCYKGWTKWPRLARKANNLNSWLVRIVGIATTGRARSVEARKSSRQASGRTRELRYLEVTSVNGAGIEGAGWLEREREKGKKGTRLAGSHAALNYTKGGNMVGAEHRHALL